MSFFSLFVVLVVIVYWFGHRKSAGDVQRRWSTIIAGVLLIPVLYWLVMFLFFRHG